jgi:hypothetical protein
VPEVGEIGGKKPLELCARIRLLDRDDQQKDDEDLNISSDARRDEIAACRESAGRTKEDSPALGPVATMAFSGSACAMSLAMAPAAICFRAISCATPARRILGSSALSVSRYHSGRCVSDGIRNWASLTLCPGNQDGAAANSSHHYASGNWQVRRVPNHASTGRGGHGDDSSPLCVAARRTGPDDRCHKGYPSLAVQPEPNA